MGKNYTNYHLNLLSILYPIKIGNINISLGKTIPLFQKDQLEYAIWLPVFQQVLSQSSEVSLTWIKRCKKVSILLGHVNCNIWLGQSYIYFVF